VAGDQNRQYGTMLDDRDTTATTESGDAAVEGALAGGVIGGLAGLLLGLGAFAIPGIGPIVAAGPLVSALVGAGVGAAGGGLLGALVGWGIPETEAGYYAEGIRRGGTLVAVRAQEHQVDRIVDVMNMHNPVDIEERSEGWREAGWTGFEPAMEDEWTEYEPNFRQHYQSNYATSGQSWDSYAPAYRYGYTLGQNPRYRDMEWAELENEARTRWETENAVEGAWNDFKDAVRHGWEEVVDAFEDLDGHDDNNLDIDIGSPRTTTRSGYETQGPIANAIENLDGHDDNQLDIDIGGDRTRTAGMATGTAAGMTAGMGQTRNLDTGEEARIPVVEEELRVGKRQVERGGVRVHTEIESQPVEEQVRLREERVRVERRPVDRPASEADFNAMHEGTIEVSEMAEEAIVDKRARVVEEVVVGKEVAEHTETIRDTIHRTDVEVEETGGMTRTSMPNFRTHFDTHYGSSGYNYSRYEPAYRFGYDLRNDQRYAGRSWTDIEPDLRSRWEGEYRGQGAWQDFKDAVRYGWEGLKDSLDDLDGHDDNDLDL
jgi:uncharacterized protein (TIGR02271 family)